MWSRMTPIIRRFLRRVGFREVSQDRKSLDEHRRLDAAYVHVLG